MEDLNFGTVIISETLYNNLIDKKKTLTFNLIVVHSPRKAFAEIIRIHFQDEISYNFIHKSADIASNVKFNQKTINVSQNVVIEKNVEIGDHVVIGANTVIKSGTIIGDGVKIGSNCTIGGVGFGYELNDNNNYELIPHIGNVILKNNVEIGNNVCIDKAVLGSTILEKEVKVDNLVHIAHGVKIGSNSLIIANAMIAGSVKIGNNAWIAPSSSIRQKLEIGDNALVGLGSVVTKNVNSNDIVAGVPAKKIN